MSTLIMSHVQSHKTKDLYGHELKADERGANSMRLSHFTFGSFIMKTMLDRKLGGRSREYMTFHCGRL